MELEDELTDVEMVDEKNNTLPKSPTFIIDNDIIYYGGNKYKKFVFSIFTYPDLSIKIIDDQEYLYHNCYLYSKL